MEKAHAVLLIQPKNLKRAVFVVLVVGGGIALYKRLNRKEKKKASRQLENRLKKILPIIIPSWHSKEAVLIIVLAGLLAGLTLIHFVIKLILGRTALSGIIAEVLGKAVQMLVSKRW